MKPEINLNLQKMHRMGEGDFSGPLPLLGHEESDALAAGLNAMCEQLEQARRETETRIAVLEQSHSEDPFKITSTIASGIAHQVNTPLTVISGYADMIANGGMSPQDIAEGALAIKAESELIANVVRRFRDFAQRRPSEMTSVDLHELAHEALEPLIPLVQERGVRLTLTDGDEPAVVRADPGAISEILLNLLKNAEQAMPRGGTVKVAIGPVPGPPPAGHGDPGRSYVSISVRDEGHGIPKEHLSRVFQPFFTTKGSGKGTGLGLALADWVIREHGGWITVESTLGKGSCFSICLPREKGGEACRDAS